MPSKKIITEDVKEVELKPTDNWLEFDTQVIINNPALYEQYKEFLGVKIAHMREVEFDALAQLKIKTKGVDPEPKNYKAFEDYMNKSDVNIDDLTHTTYM